MRKNPGVVKNPKVFYDGSVFLDLSKDKDFSHNFCGRRLAKIFDMRSSLDAKIDLNKFLKYDPLEAEFSKAIVQHLYADKMWYKQLFSDEYLSSVGKAQFAAEHTRTMDAHDDFIAKRYGVSFDLVSDYVAVALSENLENYRKNNPFKEGYCSDGLLFSQKQLEDFIDEVSSMDLDKLINSSRQEKSTSGIVTCAKSWKGEGKD